MSALEGVAVDTTLPVFLQIADGNVSQYPQVEIRDNENNLIETLGLFHVVGGLYKPANPYVMPDELFITCFYKIYSDSAHSVISQNYIGDVDTFIKTDASDKLDRILGLTQENQYIDNTTYDCCGHLTSGRLRLYSDAASVGTDNDVIATYTITATYSGSNMLTYSMVKV